MLKKLLTLIMAVCMMAAPVCAATDIPAAPAAGNEALLYSNDFSSYSTTDIVGEGANAKFWALPSRINGGVVSLNGNNAVNIYSNPAQSASSWFLNMAQMGNLQKQVTTGTVVYEANLMLPDVDPSETGKYAGGEATMSLNYYPISEVHEQCPQCELEHEEADNEHKGMQTPIVVSLNANGIEILSGKMQTISTKIPFTVDADRWYSVKCLVDVNTATFDIFVDGKLLITEVPFGTDKVGIFGVGLGPVTNRTSTVSAGYVMGNGEITSLDKTTYWGNPFPAYYDDVKLYTVSKEDANKHIKAGFEALFDADGITSKSITLPYAGATATYATTSGYEYATTCPAITLNSDATTVIADPSKVRQASIEEPDSDTSGTISFTKGKGTAAELTHTVDVTVLADEQYIEMQPTEEGMEGYRAYENFEGFDVGAYHYHLNANGIYANDIVAAKIVDSVNGKSVRSKVLQLYHSNGSTTLVPRGVGINFSSAAKQKASQTEADYVMLETDFMLPNVAPEGEAPYAGGQAVISLGEYFCGDGGVELLEDSIGEARTWITITGNKGDNKGYIHAWTTNVARTVATEVKYPYFAQNPHFDVQPDAWHKLQIVANLKSGQYDVYLNGKPAIIDAYFKKPNATDYTLRSAFIGVSTPGSVEVPQGYLLGDGTRATVTTTMTGNPFPVLYDNVKVSDITYAYNIKKVTDGFKTIVNNGIIASNALELPFYGNTKSTDCHITYSASSSLANALQIYAPRESDGSGDYGKRQYMAITRGNEDVSGTFTVTYASGFAPEENIVIPVTVKRYMKNVAGFPGFEADDVVIAKNGDKVEASVLLVNGTEQSFDGVLILCTYKAENELVGLEFFPTYVSAGNALTIKCEIEIGTEETKAKALLWTEKGLRAATSGELSFG